MAKLESIEHKIFASEAPLDEIGQFGSALDTTKLNTKDVTTIQALPAYTKGWGSAIISDKNYPTMEEMNGVLNVMSYHTGYLYQEGMPAWRNDREYSATSIVKEPTGTKFFHSLKDGNIGNTLDNTEYWEEFKFGGSGLEVCDIGMALYVDETKGLRRYLNGQIVDINTNTQAFLNRLKDITTLYPSLLCTEDEWQTAKTMSALGQVGKFVFNYADDEETVVSVRIPAIVNVQGLFDLQNLGMTVEAGLPNITGTANALATWGRSDPSSTGALYYSDDYSFTSQGGSTSNYTHILSFDASKSNPIYGNSDTVQPEAIQYPYFIQIATGAETENNIINDIELNNPYSLFDSKYSPNELNNISWLKSEGQWNAKAVYTDAYDKLLKVYNGTETVEGLSVKLNTEDFTDYDFVLNTEDETFRLPLLNGSEDLPSDGQYDSYEILDSDSTYTATKNGLVSFSWRLSSDNNFVDVENVTSGVQRNQNSTGTSKLQKISLLVKRGDIFKVGYQATGGDTSSNYLRLYPFKGNGSLYYYVGETVQNANLIDAGRIAETMVTKPMVDGQWVVCDYTIIATSTINPNTPVTYDLSSVLPDDDYVYEVLFDVNGYTSTTSGTNARIVLSTDYIDIPVYVSRINTRTSSSMDFAGNATLPVGKGRTVTINHTGGTGSCTVGARVRMYRRLGTNV